MNPMIDNEALLRKAIPSIIMGAYGRNVNYKVDITIVDNNNITNINIIAPIRINDDEVTATKKGVSKKKKKKHESSESESEEEEERPRQKRPRYTEIEGFTYQGSYNGHKKYTCSACGMHRIDARYAKNHVCQ
jgi:hypothetical protein